MMNDDDDSSSSMSFSTSDPSTATGRSLDTCSGQSFDTQWVTKILQLEILDRPTVTL